MSLKTYQVEVFFYYQDAQEIRTKTFNIDSDSPGNVAKVVAKQYTTYILDNFEVDKSSISFRIEVRYDKKTRNKMKKTMCEYTYTRTKYYTSSYDIRYYDRIVHNRTIEELD